MAMNRDWFHQCRTTPEVHDELRKLLICEFLVTRYGKKRFRLSCRKDIPHSMRHERNIEKILDHLEDTGKFGEGKYRFIKHKIDSIDVAITDLIEQAESRIREIRDNALPVHTLITNIEPRDLEKETRATVDLILLTVHEKLLCRLEAHDEDVNGLLERYQDLDTLSEHFLDVWHNEFCKCRKQFGQRLLLQYIRLGARRLKEGRKRFEHFRGNIFPKLLVTLRKAANITMHVMEDCGGNQVSVVQSSVLSYWVFDSVTNLDKLWKRYEEEGLHINIQELLNSKDVVGLFNVDRISLKIIIRETEYLKYRQILERKAPKDHRLASRLQTLDLDPVKSPVETTKTTEGNPLVDSKEALKLHYAKRIETATETEYSKHFEKIEASLRYPLSDPEKKAPKYLASRLQIRDLDPVKYPVETTKTTEGDPLIDRIETEYSKHFEKIEGPLEDPFSNLDIAQMKRGEIPIYSDLMKKMLYEINKRLSETPTILSYLLQSGDKMTRDPLYASVSLFEYDTVWHLLRSGHSTKTENIPDHIFLTSDEKMYRKRYKNRERYKNKDTNSTCVFILGEAGCGKTSYCKHLLRQWCLGEELQKFDHVFYIDTSVLQTSKTTMSNLISSAVFGNVIFSENQVDSVLRNKKCLILIDGEEYFRGSLLREYEKSTMEYCNCVFVFLTRPLYFMSASFFEFGMFEDNLSFIQLEGLDKKGMTSLYRDIMIESNKMKQSERGHEIKKGGDSQQIMNKPTLHEEKVEPDTALSVTESYLFQSKGESDTQANTEQNPTDLEQLVKNPGSGDFTKEAETKSKTERDASKHDGQELKYNQIIGILEKGLRENYDFIMKIPMLGSVCVGLLAEGKDLPRKFTNLCLCLIDKLVEGHESLSGGKGEKVIKPFDLFLPYEHVHRHVKTLRKLGNIAFNSIFSPVSKSVIYKTLYGYLEETEIYFAIRTGLLVPVQTLTGKRSDKQKVQFLHKTIQDSFVSIYIVMEKEEAIDSFCQQLTSMDVIIDVSHVIMMVCGLNPKLGCRMTRSIKDVLDKDKTVCFHRENVVNNNFINKFYNLQLRWYTEYIDTETNIGCDTKDSFYVSDIYVDGDTDKDAVTKTIVLLSDKNVIVTSLYINDVPAESGLSDKVLNDFLALNASALESLHVTRLVTYRSIAPLSLPVLTVLKLWYVHIRPASSDDEATKPLLYHLPMLQRLHLYNIELNNRLLGLTSIEGRMPMLKKVYISTVHMNDQSIDLASDMRDIEDIDLTDVKMSPPGWIKFIRSLVNIHHSYRVWLNRSDIDAQSLDMVRTDKNFEVKGKSQTHDTSFVRVWPLT